MMKQTMILVGMLCATSTAFGQGTAGAARGAVDAARGAAIGGRAAVGAGNAARAATVVAPGVLAANILKANQVSASETANYKAQVVEKAKEVEISPDTIRKMVKGFNAQILGPECVKNVTTAPAFRNLGDMVEGAADVILAEGTVNGLDKLARANIEGASAKADATLNQAAGMMVGKLAEVRGITRNQAATAAAALTGTCGVNPALKSRFQAQAL